MLDTFAALIPEEKREEFTQAIAKYVPIEKVQETALSNPDIMKSILDAEPVRKLKQSEIDKRYQSMLDKFNAETLPKLLEEERAKGQKQPWEIKIEELEAKTARQERENAIEKQKTRAISIATEKGVPLAAISAYIGVSDEETDSALNPVIDSLLKWKDNAVTEALKTVGAQPRPQAGSNSEAMTMAEFKKLTPTEQSKFMASGGILTD